MSAVSLSAAAPTRLSPPRAGRREWFGLAVLFLPTLLVAVDNTVLSFALPAISAALAPGATELLWIVDVYPLALAGLLVIFGAMLMPSTLALLRTLFVDRTQRRLALAIWATGFAAGAALGPVLGGVLLEHAWWGSVFLVNVPVMVALLVLAPLLLQESGPLSPAGSTCWAWSSR
jgi:DHA2 family multidrug resistance protein-like MFS transporter